MRGRDVALVGAGVLLLLGAGAAYSSVPSRVALPGSGSSGGAKPPPTGSGSGNGSGAAKQADKGTVSSGTTTSGVPMTVSSIPLLDQPLVPGMRWTIRDIMQSTTASRNGIDNTPSPRHIDAARATANAFLVPMDVATGGRVRVTSWYRSLALNNAIGGANGSQHTLGEAIDFYVEGMDRNDAFALLRRLVNEGKATVDQAILYHRNANGPNIHGSFTMRRANRRQWLFRGTSGGYPPFTGQIA